MNCKEFGNVIVKKLNTLYGESIITIKEVIKNNDNKRMALYIKKKDVEISPVIYLEKYYEDYTHGKDVDSIASDIRITIEESNPTSELNLDIKSNMEWEKSKDCVFPILISKKLNKELLKNHPYTDFLDLAVIYARRVDSRVDGLMCIKVTNRILETWGITLKELHNQAISNLGKEEFMVKGLMDVIADITNQDTAELKDEIDDTPKMMIIMNQIKLYAAASVLDKEFMKENIGCNCYMIPSSIHEWIVIPESDDVSVEELNRLINEVNESQVADEEILSDHVYYYENGVGLRMCA